MKVCSPRQYVSGSSSIEVLTFIMEEDEEYEDFMQQLKSMYPDSEIGICAPRTAEIVFIKKIALEPLKKSEPHYLDKYDEETVSIKKKKK